MKLIILRNNRQAQIARVPASAAITSRPISTAASVPSTTMAGDQIDFKILYLIMVTTIHFKS